MDSHGKIRRLAKKGKKGKKNGERNLTVVPATGPSTGYVFGIPKLQKWNITKICQFDSNTYVFTVPTSAGGVATAYNFQVANLPDTTIWADFEAYRIDRIDVVAKPYNLVGFSGATTNQFGYWAAYDPDDSSTATITTIAAKQSASFHSFNESWEMSLIPKPSPALFSSSSVFSGYSLPEGGTWVDSSVTSVPHFGLKLAGAQTLNAFSVQLTFRYHVSLLMNQ